MEEASRDSVPSIPAAPGPDRAGEPSSAASPGHADGRGGPDGTLVAGGATRRPGDGLEGYLASLLRDDCFRVDAVLKASAVEETQRVFFEGANGAEQGPYIRKLIDRDAGIGSVYRELFELRRAGRRQRYLPAVYDCHEAGGRLVVLMGHACGETLRELVGREPDARGRLGLALRVFPALCEAVAELHGALGHPVVHRDVTPSNVVCPAGDPSALTLVDLGIARSYDPDADGDTAYFGTRPYAPPEQFGFGQTDVRTDVYALGMVLFFCLTGRDADRGDRRRRFADPGVPEPLRRVVEWATMLEPLSRYRDPGELRRAFDDACREAGAPCGRERDGGGRGGSGAVAADGVEVGAVPAAVASPCGSGAADPAAASAPEPGAGPVIRAFGPRTPAWVGRLWNGAVVAAYAFMLAVCVRAAFVPVPENAGWPPWLRVYSYLVAVNGVFAVAAYLLLDRRRLGTRVPALARRHPVLEILVCLGLAAADWALYAVVGLVAASMGFVEL